MSSRSSRPKHPWECLDCTLLNAASRRVCSACGADAPPYEIILQQVALREQASGNSTTTESTDTATTITPTSITKASAVPSSVAAAASSSKASRTSSGNGATNAAAAAEVIELDLDDAEQESSTPGKCEKDAGSNEDMMADRHPGLANVIDEHEAVSKQTKGAKAKSNGTAVRGKAAATGKGGKGKRQPEAEVKDEAENRDDSSSNPAQAKVEASCEAPETAKPPTATQPQQKSTSQKATATEGEMSATLPPHTEAQTGSEQMSMVDRAEASNGAQSQTSEPLSAMSKSKTGRGVTAGRTKKRVHFDPELQLTPIPPSLSETPLPSLQSIEPIPDSSAEETKVNENDASLSSSSPQADLIEIVDDDEPDTTASSSSSNPTSSVDSKEAKGEEDAAAELGKKRGRPKKKSSERASSLGEDVGPRALTTEQSADQRQEKTETEPKKPGAKNYSEVAESKLATSDEVSAGASKVSGGKADRKSSQKKTPGTSAPSSPAPVSRPMYGWTCGICTFFNRATRAKKCEMCESPRQEVAETAVEMNDTSPSDTHASSESSTKQSVSSKQTEAVVEIIELGSIEETGAMESGPLSNTKEVGPADIQPAESSIVPDPTSKRSARVRGKGKGKEANQESANSSTQQPTAEPQSPKERVHTLKTTEESTPVSAPTSKSEAQEPVFSATETSTKSPRAAKASKARKQVTPTASLPSLEIISDPFESEGPKVDETTSMEKDKEDEQQEQVEEQKDAEMNFMTNEPAEKPESQPSTATGTAAGAAESHEEPQLLGLPRPLYELLLKRHQMFAERPAWTYSSVTASMAAKLRGVSESTSALQRTAPTDASSSYAREIRYIDPQASSEVEFTENATHLVLEEPKTTLKALFVMARGGWLLKPSWIFDSVKAGKWLPEADYEHKVFPGSVLAREARELASMLLSSLNPTKPLEPSDRQRLMRTLPVLAGVTLYVAEGTSQPRSSVSRLAEAAGATVATDDDLSYVIGGGPSAYARAKSRISSLARIDRTLIKQGEDLLARLEDELAIETPDFGRARTTDKPTQRKPVSRIDVVIAHSLASACTAADGARKAWNSKWSAIFGGFTHALKQLVLGAGGNELRKAYGQDDSDDKLQLAPSPGSIANGDETTFSQLFSSAPASQFYSQPDQSQSARPPIESQGGSESGALVSSQSTVPVVDLRWLFGSIVEYTQQQVYDDYV